MKKKVPSRPIYSPGHYTRNNLFLKGGLRTVNWCVILQRQQKDTDLYNTHVGHLFVAVYGHLGHVLHPLLDGVRDVWYHCQGAKSNWSDLNYTYL